MKTILAILIILIICGTAAAQNNINNSKMNEINIKYHYQKDKLDF